MKLVRRLLWIVLGVFAVAAVTLMLPVQPWRTGRLPVAPLALDPGNRYAVPAPRVWIDSDAACGAGARTDPDDCFAILLLTGASGARVARRAGVQVAGASSVFGNASLDVTHRTLNELMRAIGADAPVHQGHPQPLPVAQGAAPAVAALRNALAQGPLTIVALGPLTNIAAALDERPDLQARVTRIIAVMGRRPGHLFHPAEGDPGATLFGHGPVFRDLNFALDPEAAARIVRMGVPLALLPYDAARHVELRAADLQRMRSQGGAAAWVAERAAGWLDHWRENIGRDGFYPFDAMAAAFALRPDLLACANVPLRVGSDRRFNWPFDRSPALIAGPEAADPRATKQELASGSALYCPQASDALAAWLGTSL